MSENTNEDNSVGSHNKAGRDNNNAGRDNKIDNSKHYYSRGKVVYRGFKQDNTLVEFLCKNVLEKLGVKKTIGIGGIAALGGVIGFFTGLNSIFVVPNGFKVFSWLPQVASGAFAANLTVGSFILMLAGSTLLGLYEYKKSTTCPDCGKFYALKESKDPLVKETEVRDGTLVETMRYYKCSSCGHDLERQFKRLVENEEEESLSSSPF